MQRREFISVLGMGGPLLLGNANRLPEPRLGQPTPPGDQAGQQRPKIGCVSWCFHTLAPGGHPEEAIDIIGSLGFEGVGSLRTRGATFRNIGPKPASAA